MSSILDMLRTMADRLSRRDVAGESTAPFSFAWLVIPGMKANWCFN
jgi:hypothetical protein